MTKKTSVRENTVFREIDEMLAGVHGELTDDEIMERVATLVAQAEPETTAAWLVLHARWYRNRRGMRFTGATVTRAEADVRGMRPARAIEAYKTRRMEATLVVQRDGAVILHTAVDDFPDLRRQPESRGELVGMAEIARLGKQHGKPLVEMVKAAQAELGCKAA